MAAGETLDPFKVCPIFEILYSEGDVLPEMLGVLKDFDLTGHTIQLNLQRPTDVLEKMASIVDPLQGIFNFIWTATDLVKGFGQLGIIRIFDPTSKSQTLARFQLNIHEVPVPTP